MKHCIDYISISDISFAFNNVVNDKMIGFLNFTSIAFNTNIIFLCITMELGASSFYHVCVSWSKTFDLVVSWSKTFDLVHKV